MRLKIPPVMLRCLPVGDLGMMKVLELHVCQFHQKYSIVYWKELLDLGDE